MPNEQQKKSSNQDSLRQDRYENEIEGVSMSKLKTGLWIAKYRHRLWQIFILLLVAVSVISWGYTIYGFGSYLLVGMNQDSQMMKDFVKNGVIGHEYLVKMEAKDLIVSETRILSNNGKYDLYALIKNPNLKYFGSFSYCFTVIGEEKSCGTDFILPGEQKYVLALAKDFTNRPSTAIFSITNHSWQRINNHNIPDWKKYRADRLNISVKNAVLTPADTNEISEKINLNTLSFTALNNSAFSYWEAPFTIILSGGGKIINVNRYVINDFISYDTREIKITWPGAISPVSSLSITPDINILDNGVYKQPNE